MTHTNPRPLVYWCISYLWLAVVVRAGLAAVLVAMAVGGNRHREAEECEQRELHLGVGTTVNQRMKVLPPKK